MKKPLTSFWISGLIGRFCVYIFTLILLSLFLYWIGNLQIFLDSTQLMLLGIAETLSVIFLIVGVYHLLMLTVGIFINKRVPVIRYVFTFLGLALVVVLMIFFKLIISWLGFSG